MKRFFALMSTVLVLGSSATLVAGSIVINSQKAMASRMEDQSVINSQKALLAYRIDDPTPRAYPTGSPRTYAGQPRIDANS